MLAGIVWLFVCLPFLLGVGGWRMEVKDHANYYRYDSDKRIDEILDSLDFSNATKIPQRDRLTYKNGYRVTVASIFVDIISSSELTNLTYQADLAKIYRCFISECTAIMKSHEKCREISIQGDCVWSVFDLDNPCTELDTLCDIAFEIISMIKRLNGKLRANYLPTIQVGIGMDYGPSLMVQAGYKGSGIKDVVWMGDVVNRASKLSGKAGRDGLASILISQEFWNRLSVTYKFCFSETYPDRTIGYHSRSFYYDMKQESVDAGAGLGLQLERPRGLLDLIAKG